MLHGPWDSDSESAVYFSFNVGRQVEAALQFYHRMVKMQTLIQPILRSSQSRAARSSAHKFDAHMVTITDSKLMSPYYIVCILWLRTLHPHLNLFYHFKYTSGILGKINTVFTSGPVIVRRQSIRICVNHYRPNTNPETSSTG